MVTELMYSTNKCVPGNKNGVTNYKGNVAKVDVQIKMKKKKKNVLFMHHWDMVHKVKCKEFVENNSGIVLLYKKK